MGKMSTEPLLMPVHVALDGPIKKSNGVGASTSKSAVSWHPEVSVTVAT